MTLRHLPRVSRGFLSRRPIVSRRQGIARVRRLRRPALRSTSAAWRFPFGAAQPPHASAHQPAWLGVTQGDALGERLDTDGYPARRQPPPCTYSMETHSRPTAPAAQPYQFIVPADHVVLSLPRAQHALLIETLETDAQSSAFDRDLRSDIQEALSSITEQEPVTSALQLFTLHIRDRWGGSAITLHHSPEYRASYLLAWYEANNGLDEDDATEIRALIHDGQYQAAFSRIGELGDASGHEWTLGEHELAPPAPEPCAADPRT